MKAVLTFVIGIILFISAGGRVAGSQPEVSTPTQNLNISEGQQQILSASLMITISTPNWQEKAAAADEALPIPNDDYRTMARAEGNVVADGLGTLVVDEDNLLLVTHDHWSHFDEALGTATFHTADGSWLAEIDLPALREHVTYRDGGIMILSAPEVLTTAVSPEVAALESNSLQSGDRGFVTQQAGNRIVISEVSVIAQSEKQGRPVVRLQIVDGQAVVGGDSGGGVWVNGRFAGVMWAAVMMEYRTNGVRQATDRCVAAVYQGRPIQKNSSSTDLRLSLPVS